MTTTMPPNAPGSRRVVPSRPTPQQVELLRDLLEQSEYWVLRDAWERYLETGRTSCRTPLSQLTADHFVAAAAWLSQQRHRLYQAIEGEEMAPDGWLESLPLYRLVRPEVTNEAAGFDGS